MHAGGGVIEMATLAGRWARPSVTVMTAGVRAPVPEVTVSWPVAVLPSPNVHAYVSESPLASVEAAPEKLIDSGACPLVGTPAATATGATFGLSAEIATLAVSVPPWPSLTVRTAAYVPRA
jgi:hypothetical protein